VQRGETPTAIANKTLFISTANVRIANMDRHHRALVI